MPFAEAQSEQGFKALPQRVPGQSGPVGTLAPEASSSGLGPASPPEADLIEVEIQGIGPALFPATMSQEQIAHAIETELLPQYREGQEQADDSRMSRPLTLAGRASAEGAASTATALPDMMMNSPASTIVAPANPVAMLGAGVRGATGHSPAYWAVRAFNEITGSKIPESETFQQLLEQALTRAGAPLPKSTGERIAYAATKGAAAGVAGAGASGLRTVGGITNSALAGASGGTSAELAKEAGYGPGVQAVAGLAGSLLPAAAQAGASELTRRLARGGEAGRQRVAANLETFEDADTTPSVGQATENRRMRAAESLMTRAPGGAGVMAKKATTQAEELGERIEKLADQLAPRATGEQAGRAIQRGISGEGGFVETFKGKSRELYDELDRSIPAQTGVDVTNTAEALARINAGVPGAPNVSRFFQNSKLKGIEDALTKDLDQPTPAQVALDQTVAKRDALLRSRDQATQLVGRFKAFENDQANRTNRWTPVPGQPRVTGRYSPFPERAAEGATAADEAAAIARSRTAEARAVETTIAELEKIVADAGGKLPYQAIKQLRTLVGNEIADAGPLSDVPRSKWKTLYAALTSDMEGAAKAAGPQAVADLRRANGYYRAGMRRMEQIDNVIDRNGGPEAVFRAATSGTKEGATTLRAVMQSLPPDAQKMVSASVLRRLGRARAGSQDDLGERFSTETFLTNWNTLSPPAKAVLFNRYGDQFRRDMDQVAKVAANLREGSAVFRNPSGTAQAGAQYTTAGAFIMSVLTGQAGVAGGIAGGVALSNVTARVLTSPTVVRWLARSTRMPPSAIPALISNATRSDDPDLRELGRLIAEQQGTDEASNSPNDPEGTR